MVLDLADFINKKNSVKTRKKRRLCKEIKWETGKCSPIPQMEASSRHCSAASSCLVPTSTEWTRLHWGSNPALGHVFDTGALSSPRLRPGIHSPGSSMIPGSWWMLQAHSFGPIHPSITLVVEFLQAIWGKPKKLSLTISGRYRSREQIFEMDRKHDSTE